MTGDTLVTFKYINQMYTVLTTNALTSTHCYGTNHLKASFTTIPHFTGWYFNFPNSGLALCSVTVWNNLWCQTYLCGASTRDGRGWNATRLMCPDSMHYKSCVTLSLSLSLSLWFMASLISNAKTSYFPIASSSICMWMDIEFQWPTIRTDLVWLCTLSM